jgi:hypothetical protein
MMGRFRHVSAATAVAALIVGPSTVSTATTAPAAVNGPTTARIGLAGADPAGLVPPKHGMRQFSYRVVAGPRNRVLTGGGVDPGGPMQPAEPATPATRVDRGGPMQASGPATPPTQVNPGGPMQPAPPATPATSADPATAPTAAPSRLVACGYAPKRLRAAYGVTASGFTGKGAIISVVDAYGSPAMRADADQFANSVGDKPFSDGQYVESVDRGA